MIGKQRLKSDLRSSIRSSMSTKASIGTGSKDAFERAKKVNKEGNDLDPEIHSLNRYLKHFIIARGSKHDFSASEKVTFTEYKVCPFIVNVSNIVASGIPYDISRVFS